MQLSSSSSLNAKLYKAFCKNRFSVTLEANDIFNKSNRDIRFYNKDAALAKQHQRQPCLALDIAI